MDKFELETQIKRHQANIMHGQSIVDSNKGPLESLKAQLAELEAESAKPREFEVAIDKYGSIHGVIKPKSELLTIGDGTSPTFTVREVKPLVITREMAGKYSDKVSATLCGGGYYANPFAVCGYLKIFGIDAIPEPEKA